MVKKAHTGPAPDPNRPLRGVFAGAAALALALAPLSAARAALGVGDAAVSLLSAPAAGAAYPATAGRVVLLDFWASWCAPCKASFPAYARLGAELSAKGLVIIAVSVDEDASAYDSFVRRMKPPFFVALDRGHRLVERVQVPTMPASYLIDREGRVRFVHQGFHGGVTEAAVRREIETLLAEPVP